MGNLSIHPSAVIHPDARLGPDTIIGPYVVIEEETQLGAGCRIGSHAVIKRYTQMGDQNEVHEGVVLGGPPQDLKFKGGVSRLRIGNRNIFREGVTVHRATAIGGETSIGNDNCLMAYAHVAHDCHLENGIVIANNVALGGHIRVESQAFISGGVVVHQFCQVGRCSMIGGNSKITQDVLPFCLVDGVPGRLKGLNRVGLRRAGCSAEELSALKKAYRVLSRGGMKLKDRLTALTEIDSESVRHIVSFLEKSRRGFCRAEAAGGRDLD